MSRRNPVVRSEDKLKQIKFVTSIQKANTDFQYLLYFYYYFTIIIMVIIMIITMIINYNHKVSSLKRCLRLCSSPWQSSDTSPSISSSDSSSVSFVKEKKHNLNSLSSRHKLIQTLP